VLVKAAEGLDSDALVRSARLIACQDRWALVQWGPALPADSAVWRTLRIDQGARTSAPRGTFRAWIDRLCALQETACDDAGE
jgi:hypothetical protein